LIASDVVAGFVGQSPPDSDFPGWIQFTPGVNSSSKSGDSKGQQYCSPTEAVLERGADIIVVGRGLIKSSDVVATAENYRSEGWAALNQRITNP
jgi:uridine monophosphate synthetase